MKKSIPLILVVLFSSIISAQNIDDKKYLLTNNINTLGISTLNFLDPYLSPLLYSGNGITYNHENRRFLSVLNTNISIQNKSDIEVAYALNSASTSLMVYMGGNYGYGMQYHFKPIEKLELLAGGLCDVNFGVKYVERNVNNLVNIDMSANLNLTGMAKYDIPLRNKNLQIQLSLQTPIIGYMFVPASGASYYEMFEVGNLSDAFHFSSLHNKRGINSTLSVDVPFSRSVWRFGLKLNDLKYSANDLVFHRSELSLLIGTTFDTFNFAGRKNRAPANFISTNK